VDLPLRVFYAPGRSDAPDWTTAPAGGPVLAPQERVVSVRFFQAEFRLTAPPAAGSVPAIVLSSRLLGVLPLAGPSPISELRSRTVDRFRFPIRLNSDGKENNYATNGSGRSEESRDHSLWRK